MMHKIESSDVSFAAMMLKDRPYQPNFQALQLGCCVYVRVLITTAVAWFLSDGAGVCDGPNVSPRLQINSIGGSSISASPAQASRPCGEGLSEA